MGTLSGGSNHAIFIFASIPNGGQLLKEIFYSVWSKFFPLRVNPILEESHCPGENPHGGFYYSFASGSSPTFGALAQSTDVPTFGALNQAAGGDGGNVFGGGGFGSPSFGGQQQPQNPGKGASYIF